MFAAVLTYIMAYVTMALFTSFLVLTWMKYQNIKEGITYRKGVSDDQVGCMILMSAFWPLTYTLGPIIFLCLNTFELIRDSSSNLANFLIKDKDCETH